MYKKFKMFVVYILTVCFISLSCTITNVKAFDLNKEIYYLSFTNDQADKYVSDTIGDFINAEANVSNLNVNSFVVGSGIFVKNIDEEKTLSTFYYPVFVDGVVEYVYRIYDDGNGKYASVFGKTYADLIVKNSGKSIDDAPLWVENNGNIVLLSSDGFETIVTSKYNEKVEVDRLESLLKCRESGLFAMNVTNKTLFQKYKQTKAYWNRSISYVEIQGNNQWCLSYVTAAAIRENSTNSSVRANTIMNYYGLNTSQSCTWTQIQSYCSQKGIAFAGAYNGVISATSIGNELGSLNLILGCYQKNGIYHALLIHGIDGSKTRVWNPWYAYSEWTSSINSYYNNGTWSMYAYGYYR